MATMTRRLRLTLITLVGIVLVLALALLIAVKVLLQPQRFTDMLRSAVQSAGLQLRLGEPAEPTLWPTPAVVLRDMTISVRGQPLLVAARGRLVVPWHALLGGPTSITRMELDSPQLNLTALRAALAQLPQGAGGVPGLPHIATGIVIDDGSLVLGDEPLLSDMHLETGTLASGRPFQLVVTAQNAHGQPDTFTLNMLPRADQHALSFDNITIRMHSEPNTNVSLHGQARWGAGANVQMNLSGTLQRSADDTYQLGLQLMPAATQTPFLLALKVDGNDIHADLRMPPLALASWWSQLTGNNDIGKLPLPPLDGQLQAKQLDLGNIHVEGLKMLAGDALPASGSSTPAPAASSKTAAR